MKPELQTFLEKAGGVSVKGWPINMEKARQGIMAFEDGHSIGQSSQDEMFQALEEYAHHILELEEQSKQIYPDSLLAEHSLGQKISEYDRDWRWKDKPLIVITNHHGYYRECETMAILYPEAVQYLSWDQYHEVFDILHEYHVPILNWTKTMKRKLTDYEWKGFVRNLKEYLQTNSFDPYTTEEAVKIIEALKYSSTPYFV